MASDITITVTADPSQAVSGLEQVKKAGDAVADSARKVQQAADAAATDGLNSISAVSREASQVISQTGSGVSKLGDGIKLASGEAAKVSGALGKSIPVVQQLGSAISSAITGPVGAVSAAVGLAIAGIMKMIQHAREQIELLRMKAEGSTSAAYDRLMQGRQDYAAQLQVLSQVREINAFAEQTKLTEKQLAQFRSLAGQIGIAERDVTDRGIRSGKLGEAARSLRQQREFYSAQEYRDYTTSFSLQQLNAINESALSDEWKKKLGAMTMADRAQAISQGARLGFGSSKDEYKAWQDLYGQVKQYQDVVSSYGRDALLGRDQTDLNAAIVDGFKSAAEKSARAAADSRSGGSASPGTLAWAKEQDKIEQKELDAAKARAERGEKLLQGLDRQIEQQELIRDGKEREAFLLRNRLQLEDTLGQKLTAQQAAEVDARSARLWDLQHPAAPELAPEDPVVRAVRASGRPAAQYTMPLDSLQRIGANLRAGAASPEKLVMDQQLETTKQILSVLSAAVSGPRSAGALFFT